MTTSTTTGDEIVQDLPWRWNVQGKVFVTGGLGYFFDAWDVLLAAFMIPLLASSGWHLSKTELGLFGTIGLAGMAVGAAVWGSVADALGRKRAFTLTLLVYGIFSLLSCTAPSYAWLLVARFLAGVGLGGCVPVDYSMVAEFTPRRIRGRVLTGLNLWWPAGATACGLVSAALVPYHNWRLLPLVMAVPVLLTFWIRRSVPESPLYLVRKGRTDEAKAVIDDLVARTGATPTPWTLPEPVVTPRATIRSAMQGFVKVWAFNWRLTALSWGLLVSSLLLYYGMLIWLPTILVGAGYGNVKAFLVATSVTGIGALGNLVAVLIVDRTGRKWLMVASGVVTVASTIIFALRLHVPAEAQAWILVFGFATELLIPTINTYVPELYPTLLRATGFGWGSSASRVASALVPVIFGVWLWPVLGLPLTFAVIGALIIVSLIWLILVGPETTGRGLDEDPVRLGLPQQARPSAAPAPHPGAAAESMGAQRP